MLPCTQNCHLNANSTHCAPPTSLRFESRQMKPQIAGGVKPTQSTSSTSLLLDHFARVSKFSFAQ